MRFALIGGLALTPYRVIRATRDVDFLTDQTSADAGNYLRGDERVDFLYAHRPISRQLLGVAAMIGTPFGELRVVSAEGLIAFDARDPFEVLDDPMSVVEALCPTWPPREIGVNRGLFRL